MTKGMAAAGAFHLHNIRRRRRKHKNGIAYKRWVMVHFEGGKERGKEKNLVESLFKKKFKNIWGKEAKYPHSLKKKATRALKT